MASPGDYPFMRFRKVLALRGPNVWGRVPTIEAWAELPEGLENRLGAHPSLVDRLRTVVEVAPEASLSAGLALLARAVQRRVGVRAEGVCGAWGTSEAGVERVVFAYEEEETGRDCLETARQFFEAALEGSEFDLDSRVERLRRDYQAVCLGPSTRSVVDAARRRGVPVRRLNEGSLVQFGQGAFQRWILASETDRTGAVAEETAQDKELTRELLRAVGVPVPEGWPVQDEDDAVEAAREMGGAVVVKPQFGNQGRGVATDLRTEEQVRAAYASAVEASGSASVIVERSAPGGDYRVLVVGGKVVAAAHREPAHVVGDGTRTIRELVEEVNRDPRRGDGHATSLSKIPLDSVSLGVLESQGYSPDSVPPGGETVLVRRNANLSTGGTAEDVTERVHPEVKARCIEAARMVGLDIAGVDVVARDIARPLEEQGGVVVEVNAAPGLRMHLEPSSGQGRPVGEAILDLIYPDGQNGRIPVVAVSGVNGKTTTARFIAHLLGESGRSVGLSCTDGIYIGERRIDLGDCSGPSSARTVLMNPEVDAAVVETARGGILRAGLGFDQADVAVITNIGEGDHLGISDVHSTEALARVKRVIVENVGPDGSAVLNASDPLVAAMAPFCPGSVVFFAQDPDDPVIERHRREGGRAVVVRHGEIVLVEGARETGLARLFDVPLTHGGRIGFQIENTLASAAAAWALGIDLEMVRNGLESFGSEMRTVPGRFNLMEIGGATVVLDYGHNPSALLAMTDAIGPLPHERRLAVYSAAGDRRDEDLVRQGQILAGAFDSVYLYEDHYLRGRADGEIMGLFRRGLSGGGRVRSVREFRGSLKAVEAALKALRAGDLLLLQADKVDETLDFVKAYLASGVPGREIDLNEAMDVPSNGAVLAGKAIDGEPFPFWSEQAEPKR